MMVWRTSLLKIKAYMYSKFAEEEKQEGYLSNVIELPIQQKEKEMHKFDSFIFCRIYFEIF